MTSKWNTEGRKIEWKFSALSGETFFHLASQTLWKFSLSENDAAENYRKLEITGFEHRLFPRKQKLWWLSEISEEIRPEEALCSRSSRAPTWEITLMLLSRQNFSISDGNIHRPSDDDDIEAPRARPAAKWKWKIKVGFRRARHPSEEESLGK